MPAVLPLHGPWADPRLLAWRWPEPTRTLGVAGMAALLGAAVVAAIAVPLDRPGVGWLVAAIAGAAALYVARPHPRPQPPGLPAPLVRPPTQAPVAVRLAWAAATVALLGVGTVRSASWLFLLCLATAAFTGALASTGAQSARAMFASVGLGQIAPLRSLPWALAGLRAMHRPGSVRANGQRMFATAVVSIGLLVVFGALLASADAHFARLIDRLVPDLGVGTVVRWCFVGFLAAAVLFGAAYLRTAPPNLTDLEGSGRRRVARWEWAVPLGGLVLLFTAFVAVQLRTLFAGDAHVQLTEGLTYADYARSGFWQLLVVTGLTLLVLAGAARWAPRDSHTDRVLIRVLLGALAALTLVIVASAVHRMDLYDDNYGLTRLRLLVMLCELWLGVVFVLILIAGIRLRGAWIAQVAAGLAVLTLLGLAAANPDGLIAEQNLARYERIDPDYLANLSPDAVPALMRLPEATRNCVLSRLRNDLVTDFDDWRGWNLARDRARELLDANLDTTPHTFENCQS